MNHFEHPYHHPLFENLNHQTQLFLKEKARHYGLDFSEIQHIIHIAAKMEAWGYCFEQFWVDKEGKEDSLILLECHYSTLKTLH